MTEDCACVAAVVLWDIRCGDYGIGGRDHRFADLKAVGGGIFFCSYMMDYETV